MPSTSKAQQRLMGQAYALKKGEIELKDIDAKYRDEIKDLADSMSLSDLKDFAETKHEGLPNKVATENLTPGSLNGMGPVTLPAGQTVGSGDVPAGSGDAEEEYKKKKRQMKHVKTFEAFSFDYQGIDVKNPFTDETARMDVDPAKYYGKEYAKSDIKTIIDATELFVKTYTEWKTNQPLDSNDDMYADYGEYVKPVLDNLVNVVKKHG